MKKHLIITVLFTLMLTVPALAGFYWEAETQSSGGPMGGSPKTTLQKNYFSGSAMRTETDDAVTIILMDSGKMLQLQPKDKTYVEFSVEQLTKSSPSGMQDMMKEMMKNMQVQETSETKEIMGHKAQKFIITIMGMNMEHWVTQDFKEYNKLQEKSKELMEKLGDTSFLKQFGMNASMEKIKGFTLASESNMMGMKNTMTVTKVEEKKLADDLFEVPSGYTKKEVENPFAGE